MKKHFLLYFFMILIVFLSGCETIHQNSSKGLYTWGSFETQIYGHFNGLSPTTQIQTMERERQHIESSNRSAPPGFYAHLGLLYAEIGDDYHAIQYFIEEKTLFPEAATFMDLLLSRYGS